MRKRKLLAPLTVGLGLTLTLAACGGKDKASSADGAGDIKGNTVALVTDVGGIDDKSFNQSAWEGLQAWGKEHKVKKGKDGYNYLQSNSDSDYVTNLNTAVNNKFKTIFGIGYKLQPALEDVAKQNPDTQFGIIDTVIEGQDNVVSVVFKDHEAAFLAGVAAAMTTETKHVGFIGGQEGEVIGRFEAGFRQGVAEVDPEIKVDVQYVGSFGDPAKAKSQAAAMYNNEADIIYVAGGDSGNGVFSEAKDIMKEEDKRKVWVIGVDRDQTAEGEYSGGNLTLTSTLKGVGAAVQDIANLSIEGKFPGGETLAYGLKDGAIDLTDGNLTPEVKTAIKDYKEKVIKEELVVVEKPSQLK